MDANDPDLIVARRRLRRQVSFWRALAIILVLAAAFVAFDRRDALIELDGHVARLTINGIIADDADRNRAVAAVADDPSALALILRIDSPGGTVVGGEALFKQIRKVAAVKPVVAVMGELAASGGYMVAIAADQIFAREGTITGSIGVIMQSADITGLLDKIGVKPEAIKSAPLKAVPSPLEPLTEEARAATKALVDDMYAMFVDMVAERRHLERPRALQLADGRVYTGRQAVANGLIDAIGGEAEARAWLAGRGVKSRAPTREVQIEREDDLFGGMIHAAVSALAGKSYLSERLTLDGLVALWHPDLGSR